MQLPFDRERLDRLLDEAGIDLVLASSKHNVQYLLGGYQFFFFRHFDAIGVSRYLPFLGYPKGAPDSAFYIGNTMERWQQEVEPLWVPEVDHAAWTSAESAAAAAARIDALGLGRGRIAVERSFLPDDARATLERDLPGAEIVDVLEVLEELRAVKRPDELELLRRAAEEIVGSMRAVFAGAAPGVTKAELAERARIEETQRGLTFEYCLVSTGPSFNRAPVDGLRWEDGQVCCLDSGGSLDGYIGDLARMGSMGPPSTAVEELLAEVEAVQQAARTAIAPGRPGGGVFDAALARARECPHGDQIVFLAHGMGLITHEAPRLTTTGAVPYPARHADRPLEAGMVVSVETELRDPEHGFVKLEDTLAVTESGWAAFGDDGRGWNVAGGDGG